MGFICAYSIFMICGGFRCMRGYFGAIHLGDSGTPLGSYVGDFISDKL